MAVIRIGLDPEIHLGPVSIAWHGLTIAIGVLIGGWVAARWARRHDLDVEPLTTVGAVLVVGGIVGGRIFYVLEHGGPLLGTRGFTFDGGVILAAVLLGVYVWRTRLPARYLDAVAVGLPIGVAVGRIGDVINGEHYGARSSFFLAVQNSNPHALTPDPRFAFQNGGLYEVLLAGIIAVVVFALRDRVHRTGDLVWLVLGLFSVGRFFEFFLRTDSPELALGLSTAQWTSVAMLAAVLVGRMAATRTARRRSASPPGAAGA